jgi:hypothetical protein
MPSPRRSDFRAPIFPRARDDTAFLRRTRGRGEEGTMEDASRKTGATPPPVPRDARSITPPPLRSVPASTPQLVREIVGEARDLARKEIELAVAEVRADLRREAAAAIDLGAGAVGATVTLTLLLVTVALALVPAVPAWVAGLIVSGVALAATAGISVFGWGKRLRTPLERTRRGVRRDAKLVKEGGTT